MDQLEKRLEYHLLNSIIEENNPEDQIINKIKQLAIFKIDNMVDKEMMNGFKVISLCLEQEKFEVAKFLVKQSQENERQIPTLHYLIRERFDIDKNQFVDLINKTGIDINEQDRYGATPLHYATKNNDIEIVKLLMDKGADPLIEKMGKKKPIDMTQDESVKRVFEDYQKRDEAFGHLP